MRPSTSKSSVRTVEVKVIVLPQFLLPHTLDPAARPHSLCLGICPSCNHICQLHPLSQSPRYLPPLLVRDSLPAPHLVLPPTAMWSPSAPPHSSQNDLKHHPLCKILPWLPVATRIESDGPPWPARPNPSWTLPSFPASSFLHFAPHQKLSNPSGLPSVAQMTLSCFLVFGTLHLIPLLLGMSFPHICSEQNHGLQIPEFSD